MTENEQRAERAYRTLLVYAQRADSEDTEENMTDLLTDLRHLGDQYGVEWDAMIDRVQRHYNDETREAIA
jgi:hypothetical protein